jgi:hypothetical protein
MTEHLTKSTGDKFYDEVLEDFFEQERQELYSDLGPACQFKPLPDKGHIEIMWQVAVSSAIEGQGEARDIFARLLYNYLTDKPRLVTLAE